MNDDDLILYYYADGLGRAGRARIEASLASDSALRRRYEALRRELDAIEPDDAARAAPDTLARWHDSIERAAAAEQIHAPETAGFFTLPSFAWGSAVAAALVVGIGIGLYAGGPDVDGDGPRGAAPDSPPAMADTAPSAGGSGAFTRGLQLHFAESRNALERLPGETGRERALLAMHIVQQNRLFAREATANDAPELARVLRAFEPVLLRLAADDLPADEAAKLRAKLGFELDVMLSKLTRAPATAPEST